MGIKVGFDYIRPEMMVDFDECAEKVKSIDHMINTKTGAGAYYLGWLDYPNTFDKDELSRIIKKAEEFRKNYDTFVLCGIGGSYLGARAAIDSLLSFHKKSSMEFIYLGNDLDPNYITDALEYLKNKNFCICVISKSGSTTETSVSFRLVRKLLESKVGKEKAKDAIVAITDKTKGSLKRLADKEGYTTFILPDNIGGRFSVITPVGLFPIACAGIDVNELLEGVKEGMIEYSNPDIHKNAAYQYALERNFLYNQGYKVEILASYERRLQIFSEWWKQLFDESEGKDGKGVLTASVTFTTDLHSLGQFIQEGSKIFYETVLYIENPSRDTVIPHDEEDPDGLNYLEGKTVSWINKQAYTGTLQAHSHTALNPNITITLDKWDVKELGKLFYFFMKACAMSGYLLGVNPFNQPGVEVYKKNMFHLLGKPGY